MNLSLSIEIKDFLIEKDKKLKTFSSTGGLDSNRKTKEDDVKVKKPEANVRSKTTLSRNTNTQSSINVNHTEKGKSIKPVTERSKKVTNLVTDESRTDAYKTENNKVFINYLPEKKWIIDKSN